MEKIDLNNKKEIWYDLFKTSLCGISREKDIWTERVIERAIGIADKGLEGFLKKFQTKNENKVLPFVSNLDANGYNAVDLDLPSGTLWCDRNVGAKSPEDYGLYFAWGETEGYKDCSKRKFTEKNYRFNSFDRNKDRTELLLENDAAHVNMGGDWHMPTNKQIQELIDNTFHDVEVVNGNKGMRYISKKDTSKSIFAPFAGDCDSGDHNNVDRYGGCWSSSRYSNVDNGYDLNCNDNGDAWLGSYNHYYGFSVRGVIG